MNLRISWRCARRRTRSSRQGKEDAMRFGVGVGYSLTIYAHMHRRRILMRGFQFRNRLLDTDYKYFRAE